MQQRQEMQQRQAMQQQAQQQYERQQHMAGAPMRARESYTPGQGGQGRHEGRGR